MSGTRAVYFVTLVSFTVLVTAVECCAFGTHCEAFGIKDQR
jgi:hypothetical protein